jgi:hypothetical protein
MQCRARNSTDSRTAAMNSRTTQRKKLKYAPTVDPNRACDKGEGGGGNVQLARRPGISHQPNTTRQGRPTTPHNLLCPPRIPLSPHSGVSKEEPGNSHTPPNSRNHLHPLFHAPHRLSTTHPPPLNPPSPPPPVPTDACSRPACAPCALLSASFPTHLNGKQVPLQGDVVRHQQPHPPPPHA